MRPAALLLFLLLSGGALAAQSAGAGPARPGAAPTAPLSESQKIEALIQAVASSGASFYRNGSWHPAAAAAEHMRLKLSRSGGRIQTARDFIRYIGTRSSLSGEEYRIRMPDGVESSSADWLRRKLQALEARRQTPD